MIVYHNMNLLGQQMVKQTCNHLEEWSLRRNEETVNRLLLSRSIQTPCNLEFRKFLQNHQTNRSDSQIWWICAISYQIHLTYYLIQTQIVFRFQSIKRREAQLSLILDFQTLTLVCHNTWLKWRSTSIMKIQSINYNKQWKNTRVVIFKVSNNVPYQPPIITLAEQQVSYKKTCEDLMILRRSFSMAALTLSWQIRLISRIN